MYTIISEIENIGIIPVVKIERAEDAEALADALCRGGLPCAEITFRTKAAADAIRAITTAFPDMLVGAGTVLTTEQADAAISAGAKFIVSPGINPDVVRHCIKNGYPVVPGIATPSEADIAISLGLDTVKFFPAENAGGLGMIKAISAPYSNLRFIPTGGIKADNLNSYLDFPKVVACGGSWMVSAEHISNGQFDIIEKLTRQAVDQMLGFKVSHIGINQSDYSEAKKTADAFTALFGFTRRDESTSIYAGSSLEIITGSCPGANGHIAVKTNYIHRAMAYLKRQGVQFKMDTAKYDSKGKIKSVYMDNQIGGFAIQLVQK